MADEPFWQGYNSEHASRVAERQQAARERSPGDAARGIGALIMSVGWFAFAAVCLLVTIFFVYLAWVIFTG